MQHGDNVLPGKCYACTAKRGWNFFFSGLIFWVVSTTQQPADFAGNSRFNGAMPAIPSE